MIDINGNRIDEKSEVGKVINSLGHKKHERKESKSYEKKEHKSKFLKNISKVASSKFTNKAILKKEPRLVLKINTQPVKQDYHSIYFKDEYELDKRSLFFK